MRVRANNASGGGGGIEITEIQPITGTFYAGSSFKIQTSKRPKGFCVGFTYGSNAQDTFCAFEDIDNSMIYTQYSPSGWQRATFADDGITIPSYGGSLNVRYNGAIFY